MSRRGESVKIMTRPSDDHEEGEAPPLASSRAVSTSPPPPADFTKTLAAPALLELKNASRRPSGLQIGIELEPSNVSRVKISRSIS